MKIIVGLTVQVLWWIIFGECNCTYPDLLLHHLTKSRAYNIVNCFFNPIAAICGLVFIMGLTVMMVPTIFTFRKGKEKKLLPDNTVSKLAEDKLAEDKNGNNWGATDNGIFYYSKQHYCLKRLSYAWWKRLAGHPGISLRWAGNCLAMQRKFSCKV